MSQPRHKRKRSLADRNGEVVHVTRHLATGEVVEYDAVLELDIDYEGRVVRSVLEKISFLHACARARNYAMFRAAVDTPIKGLPEWHLISGMFVCMNRHTHGRTATRIVMDRLGYRN